MATGTRGGLDQVDLRGTPHGGTVTRMTRTCSAGATGATRLARGLVKRGIRRRRLARGVRGALHAALEWLDLLLELVDMLLQALHIRLHSRRSQRPFHGRKGQGPKTGVGMGWRCWCHHPQGAAMSGYADVLIGNLTSEVNAIMTLPVVRDPCGRVPGTAPPRGPPVRSEDTMMPDRLTAPSVPPSRPPYRGRRWPHGAALRVAVAAVLLAGVGSVFASDPPQTMTVTKTGTGTGTVSSVPSGITCGADCTQAYAYDTVVILTPTPAAGAVFGGWSGHTDCSDGAVRLNAAKTCTATFIDPTLSQTLTVTTAGTGTGTVSRVPSGITCGADCTQAYAYDTMVTLTATPAAGAVFSGWSGHADCVDGAVRMTAAKTCTATFTAAFQQVSAGVDHTCGVRADGTLACWGRNDYGEATPPSGAFQEVSAGYAHTCGVRADGTLVCWGHYVR